MERSREFWDNLSSKYDSQVEAIYGKAYSDTISLTKKYLKNTDIVLDYGCGTGITTIELAESVEKVYAIDTSKNMINIAKGKSVRKGISNIEYFNADIYDKRLIAGYFDAVMAFNVLYFIRDIEDTLKRINYLLNPEGLFISATDCLGEDKDMAACKEAASKKTEAIIFEREYTMVELEDLIRENGFSVVETRNLYDSPPNYYIVAKKNCE